MKQTRGLPESAQGGVTVFSGLSVLCGVWFAGILGIVVFKQRAFEFAYQTNMLLSNGLLLLMALLLLLGFFALRPGWGRGLRLDIRSNGFLLGYFAALLVLQLLIARSLWFYPGWDVETVYQSAFTVAGGGAVEKDYFATYPNNAALALLLSIPVWVVGRLGKDVPYTVLVYLSALMVNVACFVCMLCVRKLIKSRAAWLAALLLCTAWIAVSLIITIPYTDTFAIVFPVLALYVYLSKKLPLFPKWALISLICVFGASIKPTVLVILFAMVLVLGANGILSRQGRALWKRGLIVAAALIVGAVPGRIWQDRVLLLMAGDATPEAQHSITHFLMMGMNDTAYGGHSDEDVAFSTSFPTLAQRRQANLAVAWERVSGRGVTGNLRFFAVKLYKGFNDGTMAQTKSFISMETPVRNDVWGKLLKSVFMAEGSNNALYQTAEQVLWMVILLSVLAAMLGGPRKQKVTGVLAVTLAGLSLYLMLFEVWPRYIYLYAPIFVVLAGMGLDAIRQRRFALAVAKG